MNSIVPGNYSSNNTAVPWAIAQDQLTPLYKYNTSVVDDYNRTFPAHLERHGPAVHTMLEPDRCTGLTAADRLTDSVMQS